MTPAARRAQALRAALRHPDAVGVRALSAWAGAPPARPAAPKADPTRAARWAAALARPVGEAAMGAAWDARHPGGAAPRGRWSEDGGPVFGEWSARTAEDALRGVR
jgi:hypothetical protein